MNVLRLSSGGELFVRFSGLFQRDPRLISIADGIQLNVMKQLKIICQREQLPPLIVLE
jgi:hypothetical protein